MTISSQPHDLPMLPPAYFMEDPREAQRLADKVEPDVWVSRFVLPYLTPTSHVLDVGCGPGVLATAIARHCP